MERNALNPKQQPARKAGSPRERLFRAWRQLLHDCAAKPTRKRVHGLRVVTMRLQATIDACLASQARDPIQIQDALAATKRWKKRARQLRQKLSAVRSLDVYLIKLTGLREHLDPSGAGPMRGSKPAALRRVAGFESRLKSDRRAAAKKLAQALRRRLDLVTRLGSELEALLPPEASEDTWQRLWADLQSLLAGQSKLDAGSLHDFRRQVKGLRYRAESESQSDARIVHVAKAVKAMQDAIGEWHDWKSLAKECARQRGKHAGQKALTALLQTRAAESLKHALHVCERSIEELGLRAVLPARGRRPGRAAEPPSTRGRHRTV